MINVVSGLWMAANSKDKCLIWQYCISYKQSGISDLFFFFYHFQIEARASRPPPSYAPDFNHFFLKTLTKIVIFGNLDQNRDVSNKIGVFRKLYPNLKFSRILTQIALFRKFCPKLRFSTILTKIAIFRKFWPKSGFSTVWHQLRIFENNIGRLL